MLSKFELYHILATQKFLLTIIFFTFLQLFFPYKYRKYSGVRFKSWYVSFMLGSINWASYFIISKLFTPLMIKLNINNSIPIFEDLHFSIRFLILIFLYDFIIYWCHYIFHSFKFLRKIHNVHHVENCVDAISAVRLHFFEFITFSLVAILLFNVFKISATEQALVIFVSQILSVYSHSDIRIPYNLEMILDKLFVTSGFHMHHHSQNTKEANENFGLIFNIWDRINKTYHAPEKDRKYEYGTRTDNKISNNLAKNLMLLLPYNNGAGLREFKKK